jgi:hypothetical protein
MADMNQSPLRRGEDAALPPPGIETVAPVDTLASPCQLAGAVERDVPFWSPTWGDALAHLGWRWVLVLAPLALVAVAISAMAWSTALPAFFWLGPKIIIMILALPVTTLAIAFRTAIQRRKEPFCIHCGYGLSGLPDHHRCPECGRPFTLAMIDEYRRDPHWFIRRWRVQHVLPPADAPFSTGTGPRRRSRDGT